jgi:hypothetical protein
MPSLHPQRPFAAATQYIRIFVIVHLTSFFVTRSVLESYKYTGPALPPRPKPAERSSIHRRPKTEGQTRVDMPKPKSENTKKVAGNAKKAEAAAQKQAAADAAAERAESEKWDKGAKNNAKKQSAEDKKAATAAAKAERDKLLAEEEANQPSKPKGAGKKTAEKKSRGTLDLSQLDDAPAKEKTLNATGIDNALDALSLTGDQKGQKMDRHPERRFAAAYKVYEERRLPEIKVEHPGLRRNQQIELIRKEFDKHPDNPFNAENNVLFNASKEEIADAKKRVNEGVEKRLAEK